jgi:hypothetical protein
MRAVGPERSLQRRQRIAASAGQAYASARFGENRCDRRPYPGAGASDEDVAIVERIVGHAPAPF